MPWSARGDDLLEPREGAAADEKYVGGIHLQEFLLRMLAAALRRHGGDRAFHDLQQRLLHALARHVAGDRGIVGFAADLVDFVDIDDAALRALDIVVGGLQQFQDDVLDILADVTRFGQRRGIGHGEGHIQDARQGLREQRLPAAGRTDKKDVRLGQLDVAVLSRRINALVMIMDCDRENLLGMILAHDVIVEHLEYLGRRRHAVARLHEGGLVLLPNDLHAEFDAFIADEDGGTGDEFAHLMLALAAERAIERVLGLAAARLTHRHPSDISPFSTPCLVGRSIAGPGPAARNASTAPVPLRRSPASFDHDRRIMIKNCLNSIICVPARVRKHQPPSTPSDRRAITLSTSPKFFDSSAVI